jgi:hypothetical protein
VKRSVRGSDKKCDSAILVSLHWGPLAGETAFKAVPRERARAEASPRPAEGAIDVDCGRPGPTSGAALSEGTVGDVRADWGS